MGVELALRCPSVAPLRDIVEHASNGYYRERNDPRCLSSVLESTRLRQTWDERAALATECSQADTEKAADL